MSIKYKDISNRLEEEILQGIYDKGDKLPTEEKLAARHGVSRNTIRKALEILVRKGLIISIQGSGVFLRHATPQGALNLEDFNGLTESFSGQEVTSEVLELKLIRADEKLSLAMGCRLGAPIYFVKRMRRIDGVPYVVEYAYHNQEHIPYLDEKIAAGSIFRYIREELGKEIGYLDREISAAKLGEEDARLLGLQAGDPALISTNRGFLKNGEIFDYSVDIHHYQTTRFLKLSDYR
ncbi:GntR family transcriptional regulator [Proteiniclasticum sp. BAD-10]|uniref:GntR family transcriptional regulator n=1 Tax=Proteiniclasticum sediminis TaxID=2804028 RepID=A0A941HR38_9CLOT|nr:GntR family transcriptional regulator [Proteiniclasticum sediminis]